MFHADDLPGYEYQEYQDAMVHTRAARTALYIREGHTRGFCAMQGRYLPSSADAPLDCPYCRLPLPYSRVELREAERYLAKRVTMERNKGKAYAAAFRAARQPSLPWEDYTTRDATERGA